MTARSSGIAGQWIDTSSSGNRVLNSIFKAEPSADRGARRGSPAGVVDAPDARVNFGVYRSSDESVHLIVRTRLTLASGATALGSVIEFANTKRYHSLAL